MSYPDLLCFPLCIFKHSVNSPSGFKVGMRRQLNTWGGVANVLLMCCYCGTRRLLDTCSMRARTQTHTRVSRERRQTCSSGLMSLEEQIEFFEKMDAQVRAQLSKIEVCFHTLAHSHPRARVCVCARAHTHTHMVHAHRRTCNLNTHAR